MDWRSPDIWHAVPFVGLMVKPTPENAQTWALITRLLEAAIIGGVVMWGTVKVLSNDIDWIKRQITEVNTKQDARIDRLESWVLLPRQPSGQ